MRETTGALALGLVLATAACGGGDTDYFARTPEEAGALLGERGCADQFSCGVLLVNCPDTTCTAMYLPAASFYADEASCGTQVAMTFARQLAGCAAAQLTDAQQDAVNACFNAELRCYTADELVAIGAAATANQPYGPQECQDAGPILDLCDLCADDPTAVGCV